MKNCQDYEDQISAFLDGELSGPERGELMEHMAACQDCRQYFEDLAAIHEAIMGFDEAPVPEEFTQRVLDRVRTTEQDKAETPKVIRFPRWRRWAALAACCAFALFGAWYFRSMGGVELSAGQNMIMTSAPQADGVDDVPETMDSGESGMMVLTEEEPSAGSVLSRMTDGVSVREMYEAEDDVVETEAVLDEYTAEAAKDAPAPSPTAPARDNLSGGTLIAGGDMVRRWVKDELGQDWESGQVYALTEEQYAGLVELLTEAGVTFRVEAGDGWRLAAE